ncbi:hypothetical protein Plhal304r1_c007g0027011 [Plasmopara halstedii]
MDITASFFKGPRRTITTATEVCIRKDGEIKKRPLLVSFRRAVLFEPLQRAITCKSALVSMPHTIDFDDKYTNV